MSTIDEQTIKSQNLIKFDLVSMLTVCGDSKQKLIRLFKYILNPNSGLDSMAVVLYRKYLSQMEAYKVTRRNFIINRKETLKQLEKKPEQLVYEYILAAGCRSVYDFNVSGDEGIDLETHSDIIDSCPLLYDSPLIYVENGKLYLAAEKIHLT